LLADPQSNETIDVFYIKIFYEKSRSNVLVTTKSVVNFALVFPSCEKEHLDFERSIIHEISNLDLALPNH
jgi:hypothetical protein